MQHIYLFRSVQKLDVVDDLASLLADRLTHLAH